MKRVILSALSIFFIASAATAQNNVGVNNATPDPSAALDVTSTTQGLLTPRMTKAQRDMINLINNVSTPATGLLIYQTDNTPGFYFYNGASWTPLGASSASTGGSKVELVATKIAATQTPASANGSNTGDLITFDNVVTTPTLGTYSTTTNSYTVGSGQGGLYHIQVRALSADNATVSNTVGHWFKIEITPNGGAASFINNRDVYGPYPVVSNTNFPSGLKGRSEISAMVLLNAGDSFVIKGLSANSSVQNAIKNDGSCKLTIVKMN